MNIDRLEQIASILKQFKEGLVKMSGYKGYTDADNVKRKANNLGEETEIKAMPHIKQWSKRGVDSAANDAKKLRAKSKKMPCNTITDKEKIKEMGYKVAEDEKKE